MFYLTYRFNESAIITATAVHFFTTETANGPLLEFLDRNGQKHQLQASALICITPAPTSKRRSR